MIKQTLATLIAVGIFHPGIADVTQGLTDDSTLIDSAYDDWVETVNAKDIDRWSTYLAPGAIFFPADGPALDSEQAIVAFYAKSFEDPNFSLDCKQDSIEVFDASDLAWSRGTCVATFSLPDGSIGKGSSKWVKLWVRLDNGEWKCRLNTWNNN
jgi:ketosteroid isomerase-like protein